MITVIAGVNGAGKSSIFGSAIRLQGSEYFNPDEVARMIMDDNPSAGIDDANSLAWKLGFDLLTEAIDNDTDYTFETTLGGNSVFQKLNYACGKGVDVRIMFCGLESVELHIARVAERVANGGHNIPEDKIRQRYTDSVTNIAALAKQCTELRVFDNSKPIAGNKPQAICLFHFNEKGFVSLPVEPMAQWAKPIALAAVKRFFQ